MGESAARQVSRLLLVMVGPAAESATLPYGCNWSKCQASKIDVDIKDVEDLVGRLKQTDDFAADGDGYSAYWRNW